MASDGFWTWAAGIFDGEGCFFLVYDKARGSHYARFAIGLRADDWRVIQMIKDEAGFGSIRKKFPSPNAPKGSNPAVSWEVATHDGCVALLQGLRSGYGLRSKKARDFELWAEAVELISEHGRGRHTVAGPRLVEIKEELHRVKRWSPERAEGFQSITGRDGDGTTAEHKPKTGRSSSAFWASPESIPAKTLRQRLYAKLTQAQIDEIVSRVLAGERRVALAREFGVSPQLIGKFINGGAPRRDGTFQLLEAHTTIAANSSEFWKSEAGLRAKTYNATKRSKLTQAQIDELVVRHTNGESMHQLATAFDVSRPLVSKFVRGDYVRRAEVAA